MGSKAGPSIVLVGGGLPHLHCLRRLRREHLEHASVTVVSPSATIVYSGMLPGWMAGAYALDECRVPIEALARAAGAAFIEGKVIAVDAGQRRATLADGRAIEYDVLSLDVGSSIDTTTLTGADAHAILVRPLETFVERWTALERRLDVRDSAHVFVVGAGAGGVELALAARSAFSASPGVRISIVSASAEVPGRSGARLARHLERAGIVVHRGVEAVRIAEASLDLSNGATLPVDAAIVATGSSAPRWLAGSGLPVDAAGYVRVDPTLRVLGRPEIFASGDCASIEGRPQPRSGVHALRMGDVLLENLRNSVYGRTLAPYVPRQRALHLMRAGDGYAVGDWGAMTFEGRWVWRWKDRIDRRFIAQHTPARSLRGD